ncbi:MAG: hypothetical protein ACI3YI_13770 [Bacteroidaceae bacterium]
MKTEIKPQDTTRNQAFELWMKSPMPMVTLTKTFDVTRLRVVSRRRNIKFNLLLCWCIGKAANRMEEFYLLPEVERGRACSRSAFLKAWEKKTIISKE